jgi:glycosyltransferase involved in cell wall biosynthesis
MRIGFYLNLRHLGKWDWNEFLEGDMGLSGTDSQALHLAYDLAVNGHEVFFFSTQAAETPIERLKHIQVDDLETAVLQAKKAELELLVFVNRHNQETISGARKCETVNQPCVVWDQNGPWPEIANLFSSLKSVRRVVCVSVAQTDNVRDYPVFNKIDFVHNGIDWDLLKSYAPIQRNPLGVCYLGALKPAKGFQHLAKAWPSVHKVFPEATLTVLGSAQLYDRNSELGPLGIAEPEFELSYIVPYLGDTIEEAKSKGVTFLGLSSPRTLRSVIASSSIGVINPNCSRTELAECCSVSSLEIQALGAAIVGGNIGGNKETVKNGKTGILINSEKELASTLIKLLSNPELSRKMGENGVEWVRDNFSRDLTVQRWSSLLEAVIRNEKPCPPAFSWERATWKVIAREGIRQLRKVPILNDKLLSLREIKALFTKG